MTEDDSAAVAAIQSQSGFDYSVDWLRQRQTQDFLAGRVNQPTFIDDMWAAYRNRSDVPPAAPLGLQLQ